MEGKLAGHGVYGLLISKLSLKVCVFLSFSTDFYAELLCFSFLTVTTKPSSDTSTIFPLAQAAHFITLLWCDIAPMVLIAKLLTLLCYLLHFPGKSNNSWILKKLRELLRARPGFLIVQTWPTWGLHLGHEEAAIVD